MAGTAGGRYNHKGGLRVHQTVETTTPGRRRSKPRRSELLAAQAGEKATGQAAATGCARGSRGPPPRGTVTIDAPGYPAK